MKTTVELTHADIQRIIKEHLESKGLKVTDIVALMAIPETDVFDNRTSGAYVSARATCELTA